MKNISLKAWITVIFLAIISILTFRVNGASMIYTGMLLALLGIFLIGLVSNRYVSLVMGGLIMGVGIVVRKHFPIATKLVGQELNDFMLRFNSYRDFLDKYLILIILFGILFGLLSGRIGEIVKRDKSNKFTTVKISYMSIFIALSVMINSLRIGSISFGGFPIILSGYLLGPIPGFIVGGVSDLLGFIIRPSAFAFNPLFTLTSALTGAIPVVVTNLLGERYPNYSLVKILIGVFVGQILTSVIMVPIFSSILYGRATVWVLAGDAFIKQALSIPVYALLIKILNDRLKRVINFEKEFV